MPHDAPAALLDMVQAIERALRLSAGFDQARFIRDELAQWAIYSQIVILGEAASRVDRAFQAAHPDVPWSKVIGMRHRLVHGYDSVDWGRVWKTVESDLPPLVDHLRALLPPPPTG